MKRGLLRARRVSLASFGGESHGSAPPIFTRSSRDDSAAACPIISREANLSLLS